MRAFWDEFNGDSYLIGPASDRVRTDTFDQYPLKVNKITVSIELAPLDRFSTDTFDQDSLKYYSRRQPSFAWLCCSVAPVCCSDMPVC